MKTITLSKKQLANDAIIHFAATKENALEIAINERLKISSIVSETETEITFETPSTDYSAYFKGSKEDGLNKFL